MCRQNRGAVSDASQLHSTGARAGGIRSHSRETIRNQAHQAPASKEHGDRGRLGFERQWGVWAIMLWVLKQGWLSRLKDLYHYKLQVSPRELTIMSGICFLDSEGLAVALSTSTRVPNRPGPSRQQAELHRRRWQVEVTATGLLPNRLPIWNQQVEQFAKAPAAKAWCLESLGLGS